MKNFCILLLCALLYQLARVSLQQTGHPFCGGSLISKIHILTAAHCIHDLIKNRVLISSIKVALGTTTVPGGRLYNVARIAHHPHYSRKTLYADVAVIRLSDPIVESRTVRVIALPDPNLVLQPIHKFIVSGFGNARINGPTSPRLKKLIMNAVPRQTCQRYWGNFVSQNEGLFCVNTPTRGGQRPGVCQGDSGGPLTIGRRIVVGIASAVGGKGCGSYIPDLFTRVTKFLDFIRFEMAQ